MGAGLSQPKKITQENALQVPPFNVEFAFFDKITTANDGLPGLKWEARLLVQTRDISNLMREGFYLSPDDEVTQSGCILRNASPDMLKKKGWVHLRRFVLQDPRGRWMAHLFVGAKDLSVLAGFRLRDLTTGRIAYGSAWNKEKLLVYYYNAYKTRESFNTIHEDMALTGLWPWPRLENSAGEKTPPEATTPPEGSSDEDTDEIPMYTPRTTDVVSLNQEMKRSGLAW